MTRPWKKHLDKVVPYKPGKPIEEVKREYGLGKVVKLASNENPIGPSPKAVEALMEAAKDVNRYPDGGCFYLRQALAKRLSLPEDNFVFGNGSDEVIVLTLHAFVDSGDEVVVADPTFAVYHIASMVKNAVVRTVPLKDFKYDLEAMAEAVTDKTKVIFIANPDNPTGSYVTDSELAAFLDKIPKEVIVFIDEAYYEFAFGGDYPETLKYVKEGRNVVVARTFSKVYGLAGLRVGYGIARPEVAEILNKVREPFNVNLMAQAGALAALEDDAFLDKSKEVVSSGKKVLYEAFDELGLKYVPSKTNFILVETMRNSKEVFEFMLKKGVVIRDMTGWGLTGFIRVNVGLPEENELFIDAFKEAMEVIEKI